MPEPPRWEPPSAVAAGRIRAVAERMLDGFDPMIAEVSNAILASTPALASDPVLAAETRASTSANVMRWIRATIAHPGAPVGHDAPPEALDLARDVARRGMGHDELLTAYRQGQNVTWRAWMRCAQEEQLDGEDLVAVLDYGSRSLFGYVDGILGVLAQQMDAEREALIDGALNRRRETVMLVLDGAPIAPVRASAQLGYELGRRHVALILWTDGGAVAAGELERASGAIARTIGAGRPFTVPAGASALWAWVPDPDLTQLRQATELMPPGVFVTVGSIHSGLNGFRTSHGEARDAQRLVMRGPSSPRMTTYEEVRVASLASQDEERAASFIAATLGDLLAADGELRETVRVYLREDSSAPRTATLLHTHRNTILKRIARAERALPQPLAGRGLEVRLALELARWIGPAANGPRPGT
ncbi:hypothetical protein PAI11_34190 [Patulibacter medicamentivorans]|uniref:Regulator of polyketide synthase expression n=1 Tax=Patulibacter medicamentivorans TaxID=1097667 RepID=H0E9A2_9ACTN|nr:helix-turn-helix domain-containing protein [Patulibacter medicamentivorans]EHN09741.1 hypothetical protein PAI11_34190 [Patulibacter medicamentivorans]